MLFLGLQARLAGLAGIVIYYILRPAAARSERAAALIINYILSRAAARSERAAACTN